MSRLPENWSQLRPRRVDGLEIEPAADGFVVYQPDRDRVHYLNHTAALVLEMCTGDARAGELPGLLARLYSLPEPPTDDVERALEELLSERLVAMTDAGTDRRTASG